ncbi:hypothetical protein RHO12_03200 [Orbus sturtevantii]|uniref:hypothetical protein n=1 Tax=Orbus sturtevantii TaxID=3074109 RepID=UPI00370DC967
MLNNKNPYFYAQMVSSSYVEHLIRKNGDNIYKHTLGNLEVDSYCLSSFLEGFYQEEGLTEFERICLYGEMIDMDKKKIGCKYKIGTTHYLNEQGISKLNELMINYITMLAEQGIEEQVINYH